ncbi:Mucin-associated surface protein (MASP), subgroup S015 [Trypanosoma cruzi]|nr:Mucin-associated surface protein (MASP), subgroup S015 [Trypanosoma cruzi]
MAMMMTGRVLLVCALCVLWCVAGGGYAEDDAGVVSGGGPGTGKGKKNSEGLSSPVQGLQERQEEPAGGRGSADPQGLKDNVVPTTDRRAPNGEQEANLDVDPLTPNTDQSKNKDSTEAGAGTINQTAPPPAGPPPPPPAPPPPAPEAEEVKRTNTPEKQDSPVDHHSAQHRAVPQEKELEQEEDTQGQIINEQHESEQLPVQQEKEKEKKRSEEHLEQREHLHEKEREGENLQEEIRDQQKKQEQQEEEHEQPQEEHDESIKQGKEQEQQQQHQQHETAAKNSDGPTKNETAVGTNAIASTGDSDGSPAVSHTTSPLLLLLIVVACAAASAVVAA